MNALELSKKLESVDLLLGGSYGQQAITGIEVLATRQGRGKPIAMTTALYKTRYLRPVTLRPQPL